jgi:hypothetical protein
MSAFSNASGVVLRNAQLCDEAAQQTNRQRTPAAMRRRARAVRRHARASAAAGQCHAVAGQCHGWRASAMRRRRLHASINSMVTMLQQTEPSGVRCAARRYGSCGGPVPYCGDYGSLSECAYGWMRESPCDRVGWNDAAAMQRGMGQRCVRAGACMCVCARARVCVCARHESCAVNGSCVLHCRRVIMSVTQKVTHARASTRLCTQEKRYLISTR